MIATGMIGNRAQGAPDWPALSRHDWQETCAYLHLCTQIVGKYRVSRSPWLNHSWHSTLYLTPFGLTTGPVPDGPGMVTLSFDFCDWALIAEASDCRWASFPLGEGSVARFLTSTAEAVRAVGGTFAIHGSPNEVADPVAFADDTATRPWDRNAITRFHTALVRIDRVFSRFRTGFLGKASPVHLFWGSFDLAVTRFSGQRAPEHPGGFPAMPDAVTREAYSHELSSAGFWPGGNGADEAMFYSYAYPVPDGFRDRPVEPAAARFDDGFGEFLLPYAAVRAAEDPDDALMRFLETTYTAAADAGGWDRDGLECGTGRPGVPRPV